MASVVSVMLFSPSFRVLSGYFYVSLNLTGILEFHNLAEFRDTAPLNQKHTTFLTLSCSNVGWRYPADKSMS